MAKIEYVGIAQLVESLPSKQIVAGSSPVSHSKLNYIGFNFDAETCGATADSSMTLTRLIE